MNASRILLLTPDHREVDNLTPALDELEYKWSHVQHADEIAYAVRNFQPDLVILNALFPQVNIPLLCSEIRESCGAKILVTSAIASTTHQLKARHKWDIDEYVALPVPLKKIVRLVAYMLGDIDEKPRIRSMLETGGSRVPQIVEKRTISPTTKKIPVHGDLADVRLGRLLGTLIRHQLTGQLLLGEGEQRREIILVSGRVVDLRSAYLEALGLGDILVACRHLDATNVENLVGEAAKLNLRFGELLRQRNLISPPQLFDALDRQIISKLAPVFTWESGPYRLERGFFDEELLEPRNLLLAKVAFGAARHSVEPEQFEEHFAKWLDQRVILNNSAPIRMNVLDLGNDEKRWMVTLKTPHTVQDLLDNSRLPPERLRELLAAMLQLRMLSRTS